MLWLEEDIMYADLRKLFIPKMLPILYEWTRKFEKFLEIAPETSLGI